LTAGDQGHFGAVVAAHAIHRNSSGVGHGLMLKLGNFTGRSKWSNRHSTKKQAAQMQKPDATKVQRRAYGQMRGATGLFPLQVHLLAFLSWCGLIQRQTWT
jgi:hypothetical protein